MNIFFIRFLFKTQNLVKHYVFKLRCMRHFFMLNSSMNTFKCWLFKHIKTIPQFDKGCITSFIFLTQTMNFDLYLRLLLHYLNYRNSLINPMGLITYT